MNRWTNWLLALIALLLAYQVFNQSGDMAKPLAGRKIERLRIEDKLVVIEESSKIRGADFVVIGVIKNKSGGRLSGVKIVATFNDKKGNMIAGTTAFPRISDLGPGEKTSFEATNYPRQETTKEIKNYELQILGRRAPAE